MNSFPKTRAEKVFRRLYPYGVPRHTLLSQKKHLSSHPYKAILVWESKPQTRADSELFISRMIEQGLSWKISDVYQVELPASGEVLTLPEEVSSVEASCAIACGEKAYAYIREQSNLPRIIHTIPIENALNSLDSKKRLWNDIKVLKD